MNAKSNMHNPVKSYSFRDARVVVTAEPANTYLDEDPQLYGVRSYVGLSLITVGYSDDRREALAMARAAFVVLRRRLSGSPADEAE